MIEKVIEGPVPLLAANVTIGWPPSSSNRSRYSYDDKLAVPDLRVTNERIITYRLLDCGDMVAYDEIEGLLGRPTEGFLGLLFNMIGEGNVHWSRMTIAADGLQVSRARAGKGPFKHRDHGDGLSRRARAGRRAGRPAGPQVAGDEAGFGSQGPLPPPWTRTCPRRARVRLRLGSMRPAEAVPPGLGPCAG